MNRVIHDPSELDALPVESVIRAWTTSRSGRPIFVRQPDGWFPRLRDFETMLPATVLYDPSAPAPAPSVVTEAAKTPPVERIEGTWLVEVTDEHTCGGGPGSGTGMHEPDCGLVPVVDLATLPGWDEHLTAAPSATRDEAHTVTLTPIDVDLEALAAYFEGVTDEMVLRVRRNHDPKED